MKGGMRESHLGYYHKLRATEPMYIATQMMNACGVRCS